MTITVAVKIGIIKPEVLKQGWLKKLGDSRANWATSSMRQAKKNLCTWPRKMALH
jgi:hypothetical protein